MNQIDKAQAIYDKGGKTAIFDAVNSGHLDSKGFGYCSGCEDYTPADNDRNCIVCGLGVFGEVL
jgi:hypothetical protein